MAGRQPGTRRAAIVEIALPSSRLLTKTNVRRFGPRRLPLRDERPARCPRLRVLLFDRVVRLERLHGLLILPARLEQERGRRPGRDWSGCRAAPSAGRPRASPPRNCKRERPGVGPGTRSIPASASSELLGYKMVMRLTGGTPVNALDLNALTVISEQDDCVASGNIEGVLEVRDIKAGLQIE